MASRLARVGVASTLSLSLVFALSGCATTPPDPYKEPHLESTPTLDPDITQEQAKAIAYKARTVLKSLSSKYPENTACYIARYGPVMREDSAQAFTPQSLKAIEGRVIDLINSVAREIKSSRFTTNSRIAATMLGILVKRIISQQTEDCHSEPTREALAPPTSDNRLTFG